MMGGDCGSGGCDNGQCKRLRAVIGDVEQLSVIRRWSEIREGCCRPGCTVSLRR